MTNGQITEAQKLRDKGLSYRKIKDVIGISYSTVYCSLNSAAKQYQAIYRVDNKAKQKQYNTRYYQKHANEARQYSSQYRVDHEEEILRHRAGRKIEKAQHDAIYHLTHRPVLNAREAQRRALKAGTLIGATVSQLAEIAEVYRRAKEDPKVRCYLCGKLIKIGHRHVDHIMPLAKGGAHRPSNLAAACGTYNLRKNAKPPSDVGVLI